MPSILITGASRGFGRELLKLYLKNDWSVFPLIRYGDSILEIVSKFPSSCFPIEADITSDLVYSHIEKVVKKNTNSLDVLINNAGNIRKNRGFINAAENDLIDLFNVHCVGAFRCTKAALPFLQKSQNPVIINITSRWGSISRTASGQGNTIYSYNIAKCAQNMLTACLHQEFKEQNFRVFAVHPGKLLTSVAAHDADTQPEIAAAKLYDWIKNLKKNQECRLYDLMGGSTIDW